MSRKMVWLIGCNGMLGTEVSRQLTEKKIDFIATGHEVDITDFSALSDFATDFIGKDDRKIDFIINCAAYTAVDKAETEPDLAQNVNEKGPENLARLSKMLGSVFIHISTDYVFDGTGSFPYTEDKTIAPIGVYGKTKASGEIAIKNRIEDFYILRTSWLYGFSGRNFVYTMLRLMNSTPSLKVVNDQKGSPTFASDLADVILKIIEASAVQKENGRKIEIPYGIYNCTDIGEITWYDFACEIKKLGIELGLIKNKDCVVRACSTEEYPSLAKRPKYSVLCNKKIQNALGLKLPPWQESLRKFLESPFFDKSRI